MHLSESHFVEPPIVGGVVGGVGCVVRDVLSFWLIVFWSPLPTQPH